MNHTGRRVHSTTCDTLTLAYGASSRSVIEKYVYIHVCFCLGPRLLLPSTSSKCLSSTATFAFPSTYPGLLSSFSSLHSNITAKPPPSTSHPFTLNMDSSQRSVRCNAHNRNEVSQVEESDTNSNNEPAGAKNPLGFLDLPYSRT